MAVVAASAVGVDRPVAVESDASFFDILPAFSFRQVFTLLSCQHLGLVVEIVREEQIHIFTGQAGQFLHLTVGVSGRLHLQTRVGDLQAGVADAEDLDRMIRVFIRHLCRAYDHCRGTVAALLEMCAAHVFADQRIEFGVQIFVLGIHTGLFSQLCIRLVGDRAERIQDGCSSAVDGQFGHERIHVFGTDVIFTDVVIQPGL